MKKDSSTKERRDKNKEALMEVTKDIKAWSNRMIGAYGEALAGRHLERKGYALVDKNVRLRFGELDIVAIKDKVLIAVEVKTRRNGHCGRPCEAVTTLKRMHMEKALLQYAQKHSVYKWSMRMDVIEVYLRDRADYDIVHMRGI